MIRNLRILVVAAMVLAAFGAISATGAQAAKFHCSLAECRLTPKTDGTGKQAHHVFIVENEATTESVSVTCESLRGHARIGKETEEVTLTNITYDNCTVNGSAGASVDMNECDYLFTANGEVHVECPVGKHIVITAPGPCEFTVPAGRYKKVSYTTVGTTPNREVTVAISATEHITIPNITTDGECKSLIKGGQNLVGTYTTGNTLVTGETETGEVMADAWFE